MRSDNQHFDMWVSKQHENRTTQRDQSVSRYRCSAGYLIRIINYAPHDNTSNIPTCFKSVTLTFVLVFAVLLQSLSFIMKYFVYMHHFVHPLAIILLEVSAYINCLFSYSPSVWAKIVTHVSFFKHQSMMTH